MYPSCLSALCYCDTQDRCNILEGKYTETEQNLKDVGENGSERNLLLEKSLSTALDSFDNLFCRRCLVCHRSAVSDLFNVKTTLYSV